MYQITLNEKQLQQIQDALEIYSRLAIGQFRESLRPCNINGNYGKLRSLAEVMEYTYEGLKLPNHVPYSHGDLSWEMYQTIRQQLSYDKLNKKVGDRDWKTMMGVNYDDPLKITEEPLIKIEKI